MAGANLSHVTWHVQSFTALSPITLYQLMKLRQDVFVVEQMCPFPDLDGKDLQCEHLWAEQASQIIACLRIVPPALNEQQYVSLGRICTAPSARAFGMGKVLVQRGLEVLRERYKGLPCVIGAQTYLSAFYGQFGFTVFDQPYLEDGIPHVKMRLTLS